MKLHPGRCRAALLGLAVVSAFLSLVVPARAGEYLIADRIGHRILRYSESGTFLSVLINDPSFGLGNAAGGISALAISPDQTKLYIADRIGQRVAIYDYNGTSASFNSQFFGNGASTIQVPAGFAFSPNGTTLYVSSIGFFASNTNVSQLTLAGVSSGPDLTGGPATGRSGLALDPQGRLLASSLDFGGDGGVLRYNTGTSSFETLVSVPVGSGELGAAGPLLVVGNDLFVTAGTGGRVGKFNVSTGAIDTSFGTNGYITGLAFPGSIALGPGGNSLLVGNLGGGFPNDPSNNVQQYDFSGNLIGTTWADNTFAQNFPGNVEGNTWYGFSEATAIVHTTVVPEPATIGLGIFGLAAAVLFARRGDRKSL